VHVARLRSKPRRATVERVGTDPIRSAYGSLVDGDVEPLVSLIDPDMTWRGRRRSRRLWQRPPS